MVQPFAISNLTKFNKFEEKQLNPRICWIEIRLNRFEEAHTLHSLIKSIDNCIENTKNVYTSIDFYAFYFILRFSFEITLLFNSFKIAYSLNDVFNFIRLLSNLVLFIVFYFISVLIRNNNRISERYPLINIQTHITNKIKRT